MTDPTTDRERIGIPETIGDKPVWRCTVCDHVHGYDRELCNNCYGCRRPSSHIGKRSSFAA